VLKLLSQDQEQHWQGYSSLYEIDYEGNRIRIQIADESGKIAINNVDKAQLQRLLTSISVDETIADSLSDAIIDWRDKDDLPRENGVEKQQYADAGLRYEPRNDAFASMEEIQMVLGMTPEISQQLENKVSIYSNNPQINPATASQAVLLTLPDVSQEMIDEYIKQRVENERNAVAVTPPEWFRGSAKKSNVYMIIAEAMIDNNITGQIMAVIRMSGANNGLPFEILKWTKDYHLSSLFLSEKDEWVIN
jgi:general secretion pathway protein K